jgi:RND family efflux transporter MFP subunit
MLTKGQRITATSNDAPGITFTGKIENIGIKTDSGLNYPVDVLMDKNANLKIGMYMNVNFKSDEPRKGILIPRNTIVGSVKSASVYIEQNGIAVKRSVVIGDMVGERVEIHSGLNSGEKIITSGIMNVSDGTKVKSVN